MPLQLRYFAVATRKDGATQHFSGPHASEDVAHTHLSDSLQKHVDDGVEIVQAGVFSADFHPTPIPSAVAVDEKGADSKGAK